MAETENQIEEETGTSEFVEDITTDTTTDDAAVKYESARDVMSAKRSAKRNEIGRARRRRKKRSRMERYANERHIRKGESLWRIYMKSYAELRDKPEQEDVSEKKISADVPRLPRVETVREILPPRECFPLGGFRLGRRTSGTAIGPNRCKRTSIWRSVRSRQSASLLGKRGKLSYPRTGSGEWPGVWPCTTRDLLGELREKGRRRKRRDTFPCDPRVDEEDELLLRQHRSDLANHKELGHVRAPVPCPVPKSDFMVDRAAGGRPGLVDGDYVLVELASEDPQGKRAYANVVLRGLKGMHLPELSWLRERRDTWKFCLYQALVALSAKTQLRYKYAWSANIDYIYDHAWTLYTHIGAINVRKKQRFDDVVVYNYKYSVELELIREMKDVPVARGVDWKYVESGLKRQITLSRKDLLKVRVELGCRKVTHSTYMPVHEDVREIEEWFDQLPARYRNCVFRTTRFSLAFWQDGLFWYLYNPYRCDEFGLWDDDGYACVVKFCSKESLRRHLMILLLRAYAYEVPRSTGSDRLQRNVFDVQIFHMTFHCCQLHNLKLLQRGAPKLPRRRVDECSLDPLDISAEDMMDRAEVDADDDPRDARERVSWLKRFRVTWSKCPVSGRKRRSAKVAVGNDEKKRWHHYYVEEFNRLFSLWGEIHATDCMFDEANRGMQMYACYVVCAGMTRIMAPEYWSPKILDVMVMCGDHYYTRSRLEAEHKAGSSEYAHVSCWSKYLGDRFGIGRTVFEARMLPSVCGRLYAKSDECLWRSLERMFAEYLFGVLTCESACLGLFKFCGAYYMCDVNSFGPPLFQHGHGAAYLMRATSFRRFMTVLVATVDSSDRSRFTLNPIEILKVVEVGAAFGCRAEKRRNRPRRVVRETRAVGEKKNGDEEGDVVERK